MSPQIEKKLQPGGRSFSPIGAFTHYRGKNFCKIPPQKHLFFNMRGSTSSLLPEHSMEIFSRDSCTVSSLRPFAALAAPRTLHGNLQSGQLHGRPHSASSLLPLFSALSTEICSSDSCTGSTTSGAPLIRSTASLFLGNAMTSRMLSAPVRSITMRSRP